MSDLLRVADAVPCGAVALPFLGRGNVWVADTIEDRRSLLLTQEMIQYALAATYPGQVEVTVFDEALSGVSAPFAAANSGGEKLISTVNTPEEFLETLTYLRNHVQAVNNVVQGLTRDLLTYRRNVGYPVEGYKLIVMSVDVSTLDDRILDNLSVLMKAGPRAGVTFLIHSMTLGVNPFMLDMCSVVAVDDGVLTVNDQPLAGRWDPPDPRALIRTAEQVAAARAGARMDPIEFSQVQDTSRMWSQSSRDGITFSVGRYGSRTVEVTLGDEVNQRHNMLVTGAVGQGKSNLISVIVHSLCQRYSPDEVEFYLLDFKEGITLQQYVDESTGAYLPHARVLGLEADREFGLSVFRRLFEIYRERMALFKAHGVQSLNAYRQAHPDAVMPRIVLVIDEFQLMFAEQDRVGTEIADLLGKGVRLFRASGIHVVLASQTIGGNMALMGAAGEGLFGQVPVRMALKNTVAESHATLGARNEAAAHLRSREAIVNPDYGDVSSNLKTSVAFADEAVLAPLRRAWWQAGSTYPAPYVFRGDRTRSLRDDEAELRALAGSGPVALLGARMEVGGRPLAVRMDREIGRNIAFLGTAEGAGEFVAAAISVAATSPANARFAILDLMPGDPAWGAALAELRSGLDSLARQVETIGKPGIAAFTENLALDLQRPDEGSRPDTFLLGFGMDRCRDLPEAFQDICRLGPQSGIHVVGWWMKYDTFQNQAGYGGDAYFDVKVAMRTDAQTAKSLMNDPLLEWGARDNRALAWDAATMAEPVSVIPYLKSH